LKNFKQKNEAETQYAGPFGKLRNTFGRVVILKELSIVYFWKSGRRVVFLTIWKSENIVWQLLIRIVKI
jgi:hypothetical protein